MKIFITSILCLGIMIIGISATKALIKMRPQAVPLGAGVENYLPNRAITPGVANPDITPENMNQTICNPKWSTASIRPTTSYTNKLKATQIAEYGFADKNPKDYEEDHLISLELGGSPTDPGNLWPEAYAPVPGAKQKDQVENYLHKEVCNGSIPLRQAQTEIATNWYAVYQLLSKNLGGLSTSSDDPDDQ